ncbi:hypothetical protein M427DRAFT_66985 [Gonapodya prolifera JEL478]|uniref:Mif2/CENP-C cupin domain-containing protein n=1 Tax=Gonapodya prolifera (strain JEL478) TaxID=1344416 RepID=A0A139AT43_GONPJ|nr:hypothetical protein M427DRAFT_66985 [Gonapodya prolifera JEL478]|eukprot:KXS19907.1 hypothetical protein M427DRAFT_66985 [Gonapodya prolifera JEL478]
MSSSVKSTKHKDRLVKTRPTTVYEPGLRGRKTGLRAPTNVQYTSHGTADPEAYWNAMNEETTTVIKTSTTRTLKSLPGSLPRGRPSSRLAAPPKSGATDGASTPSSQRKFSKQIAPAHDDELQVSASAAAPPPMSPPDFEISISPAPRRQSSTRRGRSSLFTRLDETVELAPRRQGSRIGTAAGSSSINTPAPMLRRERTPERASRESVTPPARYDRAISVDSQESVEILEDEGPPPMPSPPAEPSPPPPRSRSRVPSSSLRTPINPNRSFYITTPRGTKRKATTVLEKLAGPFGEFLGAEGQDKRQRKPPRREYSPPPGPKTGGKKGGRNGGAKKRSGEGEVDIEKAIKTAGRVRNQNSNTKKSGEVDERKEIEAQVLVFPGDETAMRKVFVPLSAVALRPIANERYRFAKTFSEGEFCAAGSMLIPAGGEKPAKNTRGNAMVFCVLLGRVTVTINKAEFDAIPGDSFFVPRSNQYRIRNDTFEDARLFFAHSSEVARMYIPDIQGDSMLEYDVEDEDDDVKPESALYGSDLPKQEEEEEAESQAEVEVEVVSEPESTPKPTKSTTRGRGRGRRGRGRGR